MQNCYISSIKYCKLSYEICHTDTPYCKVDGDLLLRMTDEQLRRDVGMAVGLHRQRFLRHLDKLKTTSDYRLTRLLFLLLLLLLFLFLFLLDLLHFLLLLLYLRPKRKISTRNAKKQKNISISNSPAEMVYVFFWLAVC